MIDPETQHSDFLEAVELLGGQRSAARALNMSDRSLRYLVAGERNLHAGILEDIAKALAVHAEACRKLERKLSPAFTSNLTEIQRTRPIGHNAAHLRAKREDPRMFDLMQEALGKAREEKREPLRWQINQAAAEELLADPRSSPAGPTIPLHGRELLGVPIALGQRRDGKSTPAWELIVKER